MHGPLSRHQQRAKEALSGIADGIRGAQRRLPPFGSHLTPSAPRHILAVDLKMDTLLAARELAAIAQTGTHFATDRYDQERYQRVAELGPRETRAYAAAALSRL